MDYEKLCKDLSKIGSKYPISDGNLLQIDHAGQSGSQRINFCPMCGKDLIHKD